MVISQYVPSAVLYIGAISALSDSPVHDSPSMNTPTLPCKLPLISPFTGTISDLTSSRYHDNPATDATITIAATARPTILLSKCSPIQMIV